MPCYPEFRIFRVIRAFRIFQSITLQKQPSTINTETSNMKKIILLSAILLMGAVIAPASAGKKKDKKKNKKDNTEIPVRLVTPSDSMSYAAGVAATRGLMSYLQQQLHVDTTYMEEFIRGYKESLQKIDDPAYNAYQAGCTIASQANGQILPGMSNGVKDSPDSIQARLFHAGFLAGVTQDTTFFEQERAAQFYEKRIKEVREAQNAAYKAENEKWLRDNATKEGVKTLPSGLQYKVLTQGNGPVPTKEQTVEVVYEGKTIDGTVFDATANHGDKKFDKFRCNQVIKGWTEALTMMPVGSKWEIYIPQELAYGSRQAGRIKPYSTLIFTVELKGIEPDKKKESTEEKNVNKTTENTTAKTSAKKSTGKSRRK